MKSIMSAKPVMPISVMEKTQPKTTAMLKAIEPVDRAVRGASASAMQTGGMLMDSIANKAKNFVNAPKEAIKKNGGRGRSRYR